MNNYFNLCRYEYRIELVHHSSPNSSKNIIREFGKQKNDFIPGGWSTASNHYMSST